MTAGYARDAVMYLIDHALHELKKKYGDDMRQENNFRNAWNNLPKMERIMPICPINSRVYSWADVMEACKSGLEIKERMPTKLRELEFI